MRRTKPITVIVAAALIPTALIAGRWLRSARPWETPVDRAHRLCAGCGLKAGEVDRMIDDAAHSTLDREGMVKLWEATFSEADTHKELCKPRREAVLDAAEL